MLLPADGIQHTLEDNQPKTDSKMSACAILVEKVLLEPSTPELRLLTGQVCLRQLSPRLLSALGSPDRTPGSGAAQHWGGQGLRKSQPSAPLGLIEP